MPTCRDEVSRWNDYNAVFVDCMIVSSNCILITWILQSRRNVVCKHRYTVAWASEQNGILLLDATYRMTYCRTWLEQARVFKRCTLEGCSRWLGVFKSLTIEHLNQFVYRNRQSLFISIFASSGSLRFSESLCSQQSHQSRSQNEMGFVPLYFASS